MEGAQLGHKTGREWHQGPPIDHLLIAQSINLLVYQMDQLMCWWIDPSLDQTDLSISLIDQSADQPINLLISIDLLIDQSINLSLIYQYIDLLSIHQSTYPLVTVIVLINQSINH